MCDLYVPPDEEFQKFLDEEKKKDKIKKKLPKKKKNPNLVTRLAYRMRHAKDGTIWHSLIDPLRPNSPPVEWPEYPDSEIREDLEAKARYDEDPTTIEELLGNEHNIKDINKLQLGNKIYEGEKLDSDGELDMVHLPEYPGLYSSEQYGMHQHDEEDNDDDDPEQGKMWGFPDGDEDFDPSKLSKGNNYRNVPHSNPETNGSNWNATLRIYIKDLDDKTNNRLLTQNENLHPYLKACDEEVDGIINRHETHGKNPFLTRYNPQYNKMDSKLRLQAKTFDKYVTVNHEKSIQEEIDDWVVKRNNPLAKVYKEMGWRPRGEGRKTNSSPKRCWGADLEKTNNQPNILRNYFNQYFKEDDNTELKKTSNQTSSTLALPLRTYCDVDDLDCHTEVEKSNFNDSLKKKLSCIDYVNNEKTNLDLIEKTSRNMRLSN